jgi:hypothetical protein
MTAKGFCTCERDFPGRYPVPWNATWHYLCDRPILWTCQGCGGKLTGGTPPYCIGCTPEALDEDGRFVADWTTGAYVPLPAPVRETGTGWPGGTR